MPAFFLKPQHRRFLIVLYCLLLIRPIITLGIKLASNTPISRDHVIMELIYSSVFLFIIIRLSLYRVPPHIQRLDAIRQAGTLSTTTHYITRAFAVEKPGHHPAYYAALDDGRVLFLSGPYLAKTGPPYQVTFPVTDFQLCRDTTTGEIVHLQATGTRLPLDATISTTADLPADGTLITDRTYDQLLATFTAS